MDDDDDDTYAYLFFILCIEFHVAHVRTKVWTYYVSVALRMKQVLESDVGFII